MKHFFVMAGAMVFVFCVLLFWSVDAYLFVKLVIEIILREEELLNNWHKSTKE